MRWPLLFKQKGLTVSKIGLPAAFRPYEKILAPFGNKANQTAVLFAKNLRI